MSSLNIVTEGLSSGPLSGSHYRCENLNKNPVSPTETLLPSYFKFYLLIPSLITMYEAVLRHLCG
jgi:hypothetical protein